MTPACMGGWCVRRGHCPHYHAADRRQPEERLCPPGMDGAVLALVNFKAPAPRSIDTDTQP